MTTESEAARFSLPFRSPWWLPGGHLQTVWRKLSASGAVLPRSRQRIELPDGDFIDLDIALADNGPAVKPLVLLVHGLAGSAASPYIVAMQSLLQGRGQGQVQGHDSVAMNLRGCSGEFNRLAQAYHSGCSADLEAVVTALRAQMSSEQKLVVIGYSLGANVLVKWLSETEHQRAVLAGISVSNPFSLAQCCERMNRGVAFWYGRYFLNILRKGIEEKQRFFESQGRDDQLAVLRALGPLASLRTLWDFDDAVTAPLHGFNGAQDYYQRCSSRQFLPKVRTPLLIIHGHNDPIIPPQALPTAAELPAHIHHEVLAQGGHVGFAATGQAQWLEQRMLNFIRLCTANAEADTAAVVV